MEIGGPYPFRAVAAYQPAGRVINQPSSSRINSVRSTAAVSPPHQMVGNGIDRLVAGRVSGSLEFDSASVRPVRRAEALQLYTRAADRIEAATGVHRGRIVDLRG